MLVDNDRKEVGIGSWVKVIHIDPAFLSALPTNESKEIKSMLNQVLEVTGIAHGKALVEQHYQSNKFVRFTLALSSEEMELVNKF